MNESDDTTVISNAPPEHPGLDFNLLRQAGIRHLQELSGKIWTDHNLHDPGITILDQLCYALNDLSYRIDYDIRDLLATENGDPYESLYSPAKIMTTNPVTLLDIRKTVIDVNGVRNAWVEKVSLPDPVIYVDAEKKLRLTNPDDSAVPMTIRGLYRVLIDSDQGADIQPAVKKRLLASRNVCEDFLEIRQLQPQDIALTGSIEIGEVEDINSFAADLLAQLSRFVSPQIRFYTLQEMLDKGKRIDEIVDGPLLDHGFIEDEELIRYGRSTELHTSDFIREIMDVPGVAGIHNIRLFSGGAAAEWRLVLDGDKTPKIDVKDCLARLQFMKNGLSLQVDAAFVIKRVSTLLESGKKQPIPLAQRDIVTTAGDNRDIATYHSIQEHFPLNYGIGESGLPDSVSLERRAQAQQLKAYLLFFDQLLANYFAHVAHLKDLFAFTTGDPVQTYFSQSVTNSVYGSEELFDFETEQDYRSWLKPATESGEQALERKNRFLNHLMARFSERFTHYSLLVYDYSNKNLSNEAVTALPPEQLIRDKVNFLKDYPAISGGRYKAFDYSQPGRDTDPNNVSGLEKRIAMKLGIRPESPITPATERFYMLEHILLRPVKEDFMAYLDFLVSQQVTAFEDTGEGTVRCFSVNHRLQNGDMVVINGTKSGKKQRFDGTYAVQGVLTDSFLIQTTWDASVAADMASGDSNPTWIRPNVDTTFMILTQPVAAFAEAGEKTRCNLPAHGLVNGEMIEINGPDSAKGPHPYAGTYSVAVVDADNVDIERTFTTNAANARWISMNQKKDPYSLQLTFVFPEAPARFRDPVFHAFIEQTIREETPVHLTVYIRWLAEADMERFESAYTVFLEQLTKS